MANVSKQKMLDGAPGSDRPVTGEERLRRIAEAAYFRALNRGFQNGDTVDDWLAAEREIDAALLAPVPGAGRPSKSARGQARGPSKSREGKPHTGA